VVRAHAGGPLWHLQLPPPPPPIPPPASSLFPPTLPPASHLPPPAADIKVKEPDFEAMGRGRKAYLPPRFMTVSTAIEQLLLVESTRGEGGAFPFFRSRSPVVPPPRPRFPFPRPCPLAFPFPYLLPQRMADGLLPQHFAGGPWCARARVRARVCPLVPQWCPPALCAWAWRAWGSPRRR
jgi:hypothetical protein